MTVKKKGRVYPSLHSPSLLSSYRDTNSVFKLLPVAILTLATALPPQDQEVLAYMITRSIISTTNNPSNLSTHHHHHHHHPKNRCKKGKVISQCGCFDCYTRFWHRWDSSPNRDLIHQVIEAFEEHLMQNEVSKKHCKASSRKKDKVILSNICESNAVYVNALQKVQSSQDSEMLMVEESEGLEEAENKGDCEQQNVGEKVSSGNLEMEPVVAVTTGVGHKGLARKVLPDVVGLFNSRLWSLWDPSI